ncbi:DUF3558 domain-containing protein [Actinokineospora sp. UTMC 2448]|uniref:DUF3558 domain-containing protein n=1 Tax=Actinokineospora sp. UTMC 2448 TaxID=2268449 RepID=UPI002164686E|nr:DUF3558 domain-containing protein [Actinokineospora sp. UTMC 2448]UVS80143.1 hypothetical protein Actkin_03893 [Actinokineospora sp. UTMC 2448]
MRATSVIVGLAFLTFAAGCVAEPGTPVASRPSTSIPAPITVTTPPRTRVTTHSVNPPEVATEIDVLAWTDKPCAVLTDAQANHVGINAPAESSMPNEQGARCSRRAEAGGPELHIRLFGRREDVTKLLLATDERTEYLAHATVGGQPAVVASNEPVPERRCVVGVMMAENQSIQVDLRAGEHDTGDVCDRALVAAEMVVATIAGT